MLTLAKLVMTFGMLSLLAVGGGTAVLQEMQDVLLARFDITPEEFLKVYSVGQLAPGPNMLMVVIFGIQIAGVIGALVVGLSFFVPSSVFCFWTGRFWHKIGETPWRRALQNALEPISIGLMCSGVYSVAKSAVNGPLTAGLAVVSYLLIMHSRINPVFIMLGLGVAGGALMDLRIV